MSVNLLALLSAVAIVLLTVGFSFLFKKKTAVKFRLSVLSAHAVFIVAIMVLVLIVKDQFFWMIPMLLDAPTAFGILVIFQVLKAQHLYNSVFTPFLFFLILGGIQYFFIGWGVDYLAVQIANWRKEQAERKKALEM